MLNQGRKSLKSAFHFRGIVPSQSMINYAFTGIAGVLKQSIELEGTALEPKSSIATEEQYDSAHEQLEYLFPHV